MGLLKNDYGWALLAGLSCVFGFAPFGIFPIPLLALAVLFTLWQRAVTPRKAAWLGFAFGLGLFSAGIGGIYIAMHVYGDMPLLLALLATLLFSAFWALLPALAGYAQARIPVANGLRIMLVMPAVWALLEWFRGLLVTGFPWLTLGYAQSDTPLAGYAPVFGVYGVSLAMAISSGLLAWLFGKVWNRQILTSLSKSGEKGRWALALSVLLLLWITGALLRTVAWTQKYGEPFSVALVQGNIAQNLKFNEDALVGTLETYRRLVLQNEARLTVLPETALPLLRYEVPPTLIEQLGNHARLNGGDVLIGVFERDQGSYYNSAFTLGAADEQHYRKQHLVPFGEFIPLRPLLGWFINGVLNIPMGDLARGDAQQVPLDIAGQHVAVNICYEDAFGEEIIRALPRATLLVNVTNDAWYGNSPVAAQHNQMAQLRAMESGRMMLRATNTGVTSIIGADGKVLQQLPQHVEAVLQGQAQGYQGSTPYARWGNAAVLLLIALILSLSLLFRP
jgi:apolipoprotein N-acyltransferase